MLIIKLTKSTHLPEFIEIQFPGSKDTAKLGLTFGIFVANIEEKLKATPVIIFFTSDVYKKLITKPKPRKCYINTRRLSWYIELSNGRVNLLQLKVTFKRSDTVR